MCLPGKPGIVTLVDPEHLVEQIDAVWALLETGDLAGANKQLQALEKDAPEDPRVVAVSGAMCAASGDVEEAVARLLRAYDMAPDKTRYLIDAAELQLHGLDDPDAAIASCAKAIDTTSHEDELIDALLLEAEALIGLGERDDEARTLLAELDGCSIDDPRVLCQAGDLRSIMGDLDAAETSFNAAIALDENCADAYHGLGLVHESRDQLEAMVIVWTRVRELDLAVPRPAWQLDAAALQDAARTALSELPTPLRPLVVEIPIVVEEAPSEEYVRYGVDPREAVQLTGAARSEIEEDAEEDGAEGAAKPPELRRIHIFARNLERMARSADDMLDELRMTILTDTAQFFGLDA